MAPKLPVLNSDNANVAKVRVSSRAAAGKTLEQIYQNKLELEHILTCPAVYIGAIEKHTQTLWVYENDEMVCRSVTYVPGLYRIFDEILVNAADITRIDPSMDSVKVVIDVKKNLITVCTNGDGVPVEIHQEDNVKKTTSGRTGYGAKITSIFSTEFIIEIADGKRLEKSTQVFENNMRKKSEPVITNCNKSENWTKVTFKPDLKRFNMTELENDVVALMRKRVFDIAGCLGKSVKVELNGELVPIKSFNDYVDLYLRTDPLPRMTEKVNDRWEVCVSLSDGPFQQVSFVNSIATIKGGTHVDYVTSQVTDYIVGIVNKKNKIAKLKPQTVKNHLRVFVNALIDNPVFDSPTKETLTLPRRKFGSKCELSEVILKKVAKSGVVENLLSWATFEHSKELKKSDGAKTEIVDVDKLEDAEDAGGPNSHNCTLIVTEGDSAKTLAMVARSLMGSNCCGVYPLRGKLLNVRKATLTKIIKNKDIVNLKKVLGLKHGMVYTDVESLRYGHLMIMTDQDYDGSHIKGLIINFIHFFWTSLLQVRSFIVEYITPIVKATHKTKGVQSFYSMHEYERWKESLSDNETGWTTKYYKGLATSSSEEGIEYFEDVNFHRKEFVWEDVKDGEAIEMAFCEEQIKDRKYWLTDCESGHLDPKAPEITYSDFINKELILFGKANLQRSIPSMVDGLKSTQRKILFTAFNRNLVKEAKLELFVGYIHEDSAYRGGQSLASTIICMAEDYLGSNNVNLLQPNGQYSTRASGGKYAASKRYISTKLSPATRVLFPKDDDVLLDYLIEDEQKIEPTWYMPIIPTVLVNGSGGIGSGWSTSIPNYNPREIVANIQRLLNGESMVPMHPWYRGFTGTIKKTASKEGGCTYTTSGICVEVDETTLRIKELPIGKWTNAYIKFLNSMKAANGESFIQSIKDNCDERSVDLQITLSKENLRAARDEGFEKKFKLTTTIATTNMHLLDKEGGLKKYATPETILEEFFELRLEYYEKRKEIMVKNLELELLKLENKVKFLNGVRSGEIVVRYNREKADFVQDLRQREFTPFPEMAKPVEAAVAGATDGAEESEESSVAPAPSSQFIPGSDYDYLLAISLWTRETEKVKELSAQRDQTMVAVEDLKNAEPRSLWLKDLEAFVKELDELDEKDAQAKEKRQVAQGKIRAQNQAPKKTAPKKASEPVTTEASNSAMDTDNNVAEVVKPKGRQGDKRKAPAAKEVEEDYSPSDSSINLDAAEKSRAARMRLETHRQTLKAISLDDDDDDVVATGVSPEKKVRKMRSSPFNKKSSSVMSRLASKEVESSENAAGNSSSVESEDVLNDVILIMHLVSLIIFFSLVGPLVSLIIWNFWF